MLHETLDPRSMRIQWALSRNNNLFSGMEGRGRGGGERHRWKPGIKQKSTFFLIVKKPSKKGMTQVPTERVLPDPVMEKPI